MYQEKFTRKEAKEILASFKGPDTWLKDWRDWFEKVNFSTFKVKNFADGSNLWSVVSAQMKEKYMLEKVLDCKAVPAVNTKYHPNDLAYSLDVPANQEQEKSAMCYANTPADTRTEVQQAKDYLIKSLELAVRDHDQKAYKHFNIDHNPIQTVADLKKAVKEGWFKLDEKMLKGVNDESHIGYMYDYIRIENPEKPYDFEGYTKARTEVRKAASDVKDQIVVFGPEKGLEALNEFKAKTFY